jgi:hypothetical protein
VGVPATCRAHLTGGTVDKSYIGVTLFVADPLCGLRDGTPFLSSSRESTVALTKPSLDLDVIARALQGRHSLDVVAHLGDDGHGLIGAFIGGQLMGRMTPKMSERYVSVLNEVYTAGLPVSCWAHLRHGHKAVEARLLVHSVESVAVIDGVRNV